MTEEQIRDVLKCALEDRTSCCSFLPDAATMQRYLSPPQSKVDDAVRDALASKGDAGVIDALERFLDDHEGPFIDAYEASRQTGPHEARAK